MIACGDPESFVRGWSNSDSFFLFLVDEGREDPKSDDGPLLDAGLVTL